MLKEEKMINRLKSRRNRTIRIISSALVVILSLTCLIFMNYFMRELDSLTTPEQISAMASFENPKEELPVLFSRFYKLAEKNAKLMFYSMFYAVFIGIFISFIIIQIADLTNRRLIVCMWDRIEELEQKMKEIKQDSSMES